MRLQDKFAAKPDDTIPRAVLKDLSKAVESLKKDTLQEDVECLKELIEEKKEYDEVGSRRLLLCGERCHLWLPSLPSCLSPCIGRMWKTSSEKWWAWRGRSCRCHDRPPLSASEWSPSSVRWTKPSTPSVHSTWLGVNRSLCPWAIRG